MQLGCRPATAIKMCWNSSRNAYEPRTNPELFCSEKGSRVRARRLRVPRTPPPTKLSGPVRAWEGNLFG
eukprot:6185816-Alexandrium_andersonii.AAC.1